MKDKDFRNYVSLADRQLYLYDKEAAPVVYDPVLESVDSQPTVKVLDPVDTLRTYESGSAGVVSPVYEPVEYVPYVERYATYSPELAYQDIQTEREVTNEMTSLDRPELTIEPTLRDQLNEERVVYNVDPNDTPQETIQNYEQVKPTLIEQRTWMEQPQAQAEVEPQTQPQAEPEIKATQASLFPKLDAKTAMVAGGILVFVIIASNIIKK